MSLPAIRIITPKSAKPRSTTTLVHLLCHVKPGVNAQREGISAVTDSHIEVCVAAQAREGEANKAVREVIADALGVPKSDVSIARGMKSREKTVEVALNHDSKKEMKSPEEEIQRIKSVLMMKE